MKKFFQFIFSLIVLSFGLCANPQVNEYILENGMQVYVLEDFSSALIRVEYTVAAGFSHQTPQDAGFFPLYSRLFKYAAPEYRKILSGLESECNADSSRYIETVSFDEFELLMKALASAAFNPVFLDEDFERELADVKKSVSENAFSIEGFINSAIDSRVFAEAPWKHDSGIYPGLFSKSSAASARLKLSDIGEKFYRPSDSAVFISGPVTKEKALETAERTFGKAQIYGKSGLAVDSDFIDVSDQKVQKLFVLSDPEFSPDMTQIVVQYKSLLMEEADCGAQVLDQDNSYLKTELLSKPSLGIRSPQYINAASTHKNGTSRLIIQSLLENPKTSPYKNAVEFVNTVKASVAEVTDEEFERCTEMLVNSFEGLLRDSSNTMDFMSQYWAVKDYYNVFFYDTNQLVQKFFDRPARIKHTSLANIQNKVEDEEPYVFVLVNSKVLEKYRKNFTDNGYEIVTAKNGSWYTQALYKAIRQSVASDTRKESVEEKINEDQFVSKNAGTIVKYELKNKIPVYIKNNPASNTVTFALMIDGGEAMDEKIDYGIENVIIDAVALKIKTFLYEKYDTNQIKTVPEVYTDCALNNSIIYTECLKDDLEQIIEVFADALIFTDFIPAMVDSVVMERKSSQIVKTSSPVYQLYSSAIRHFYAKNKIYSQNYSLNKDILKKVSFTKILDKTTRLFNADRYKIILSGNLNGLTDADAGKIISPMNDTFGILPNEGPVKKAPGDFNLNAVNTVKVKLVHLFLTDVSKDKAGPRPQVLIPTTEFLDPAQYWFYNSSEEESSPLFNAVLFDFADYLESKVSQVEQTQKMLVRYQPYSVDVPFGTVTVLNLKNVSTLESIYLEAYDNYAQQIDDDKIMQIKAGWIKKQLSGSQTNNGIALLIRDGLSRATPDPEAYIKDYSKVMDSGVEAYRSVFEDFEFGRSFRFYSTDTKK